MDRFKLFNLVALLLMTCPSARALPLQSADPSAFQYGDHILTVMPPLQFAVDERLKRNVDFWVRIYTQYYTYQGVIHDAKYIDHVYEVMDFQKTDLSSSRAVRQAKKRWKDVLLSLHKKTKAKNFSTDSLTADEKAVFELFQDVNEPDKFLHAAHRKRLRFQLGQKDRFLEGLKMSGRYLPIMEEIFRREGLPVELTRLPFVESTFNLRARSKVGASGIWQFMRSTGRLFIRVNDSIDERNDPIRATEAAAKLLRVNYESLRSWPLAVTAYNHGRKGLMRAVRKVGSDELEDLVSKYRSRSFGFASTNFFTELLAAIEVEKNADKYFGPVQRDKPLSFVEARIPDYIQLSELERFLKLDHDKIRELNPGLSEQVLSGRKTVPAGYQLRLPYDAGKNGELTKDAAVRVFLAGYEQIPAPYKLRGAKFLRIGKRRTQRE